MKWIAYALRASLPITLLISVSPAFGADTDQRDQEMERFLRKARVTRIHRVMSATTYPMALDLEMKGQTHRAAFKYDSQVRPVPIGTQSEDPVRTMLDSYVHEVAAYRLDRALGLKMVPVAVLREIKTPGAVIEWISGTVSRDEAASLADRPTDPEWLERQEDVMRLFDALTDNVGRRESDVLISTTDWKMRLIDHSSAFGMSNQLPERFSKEPVRVPRTLLNRLEDLDEQAIRSLLDDLLVDGQIHALIVRRDLLLEKVAVDRLELGDEAVLSSDLNPQD
jgi:hypothetical protein